MKHPHRLLRVWTASDISKIGTESYLSGGHGWLGVFSRVAAALVYTFLLCLGAFLPLGIITLALYFICLAIAGPEWADKVAIAGLCIAVIIALVAFALSTEVWVVDCYENRLKQHGLETLSDIKRESHEA